jgi:hypothetical protein
MTYEEQVEEALKKKEGPGAKFVKEAGKHLIGIAKCKAEGDEKGRQKHHEQLDEIIHNFSGKRKGE